MLTFSSAVDYLLDNGYLAFFEGEIVITGKFKREFKPIPKPKLEQIFQESPEIISREKVWKKFMEDAQVPYQVTATDGKKYTIRQYSAGVADKLINIIKQADYETLVECTKLYYGQNGYKKTFKNYLEDRVWEAAYAAYQKAKDEGKLKAIQAAGSGGNRFED